MKTWTGLEAAGWSISVHGSHVWGEFEPDFYLLSDSDGIPLGQFDSEEEAIAYALEIAAAEVAS